MLIAWLIACQPEPDPPYFLLGGPTGEAVVVLPLEEGEGPAPGRVEEAEGRRHLRLVEEGGEDAITGRYTRDDRGLSFEPAFALLPGHSYVAEAQQRTVYRVPDRVGEPVSLSGIFPTVDELPANALRLHLRFSGPMRGGSEVFEHIALFAEGREQPDPLAFRELPLWSQERDALTLLLHPGRIKTDIPFAAGQAPVLEEGGRYRLVISGSMPTASGGTLGQDAEKRFAVGPADRTRPLPESWRLHAPAAQTREPVVLDFGETMDLGLALGAVTATGPAGELALSCELGVEERSLRCHPGADWLAGRYALTVDPDIADLAGNTPGRLFDGPFDAVLRTEPLSLEWAFEAR